MNWRESAAIPISIALGVAGGMFASRTGNAGVAMMLYLSILAPLAIGFFFRRRHVAAAMLCNGLLLAIPIFRNLQAFPDRPPPDARAWIGLIFLAALSMGAAQLSRLGAMLRR
jgi:hypothetical protein